MNKSVSFGHSLGKYPVAIGFIFSNGLGWYFIFPLLMHIGLLYVSIYSSSELVQVIQDAVNQKLASASEGSAVADALSWIAGGLIWLLMKVLFFFLFAYVGGYIVLMFLSPVLAYLSEKTETILMGNKYDADMQQIAIDAIRGTLLALRNMFVEMGILIAVFILSLLIGWIPLIGWLLSIAGQVFLLIVSAYFYGFSFMYYTLERRRLGIRQSISWARSHKAENIGIGLPFALCLVVPFAGGFIASFYAIISTVAGTMTACEMLDCPENSRT